MSQTELVQTNSVKVGQFLVVEGKPCRVVSMAHAKPGKHGSSKTMFSCKDLLTGKNVETSAPSKGTIEIPKVVRESYIVLDVNRENYMTLMKNGILRQDVKLDGEYGEIIKAMLNEGRVPEIVLMTILDHTLITQVRESTD